MANYTIDKIKYGDHKYILKDSDALHLTSDGNLKIEGTLAAEEGIFNKLIATNATIDNLDVDDLSAQNATIVGLLDVQGEMHTKSWTNANISNVGGSFYISPTVSTTIDSNNTPMSITIGGSANNRKFQVTGGNFATDAVKIYDGTSTSTVTWVVGSHVMVTGNIRLGTNGVDYPLGTLTGYLDTAVTSGGPSALVANGFTVGEINSPALENIIAEIGTSNLKSYEIKISMFEIGPKTSTKPVGIMMTSYGLDNSTYIDIYGGVNQKNTDSSDNIPNGFTDPNVRIGYLGGIPQYTDSAGKPHTPTGWGIYTDNGYFKGVIVADSGSIGHFTINSKAIYSGSHDTWNKSSTGIFLGTNDTNYYISGGSGASWWIRDDGRFQFGGTNGITYNGTTLSIPAANVSGTLTAATIDASKINSGDIAAARIQTYLITAINAEVSDISALTATLGGFQVDATAIHTNGVAITSNATNSIALSSANFARTINNTNRTGLRLAIGSKFGVTGDGTVYASNANISGSIEATSFVAKNGTIDGAKMTSSGLEVFNTAGDSVGLFGSTIRIGKSDGIHMEWTEDSSYNSAIGLYDGNTIAGYIYMQADTNPISRNVIISATPFDAANINHSIVLNTDYILLNHNDNNSILVDRDGILFDGNAFFNNEIDTLENVTVGGRLIVESTATNSIVSGGRIQASEGDIWMGKGSTNRHGIYSTVVNEWLVYADATSGSNRVFVGGSAGNRFCPYANASSAATTTAGLFLGDTTYSWKRLYAYDTTIAASDRKLKDILGSIDFANDLIMSLKPIKYMWKNGDHRRTRMGFIAQDVAKLCNNMNLNLDLYTASYTDTKGSDEYYGEPVDDEYLRWGLAYDELIAPMIQVIQNQQTEINQLKQRVQQLEGGN